MRAPWLLIFLLLSCGTPEVLVRGAPCTGCRDAHGACLPGDVVSACGAAGASCEACASTQTCRAGACVSEDAGVSASADGGSDDGCAAEARLVYVIDQDRTVSSFNPQAIGVSNAFTELGRISCPSASGAEPFSMSVDRHATAWIVYDSGELFTVALRSAPLTCVKTAFSPQLGVAKFGMGFVANAPGSHDETLFISGSDLSSTLTTTKFGTLSVTPPHAVSVLGTLGGAPELTGTGDGKLWAFFPNLSPPKVAQLSKLDGASLTTFEAPTLAGTPRAWAFAFWGGDFFVFLERDTELSTSVWKLDGQTGALSSVLPSTGRRIVGAGVSTCAPVEIN
ncbi:MAG: hypothetical protein ACOZQL_25860 [Myxococcota bacterium]